MKYLRRFFESHVEDDILETIRDIFMEMTDDGVNVDIKTSIQRIVPHWTMKHNFEVQYTIRILFSGKFKPVYYIESFDHLNNFLEHEGWEYSSNGTPYKTYSEKRESLKSDSTLSLLEIKYIKYK